MNDGFRTNLTIQNFLQPEADSSTVLDASPNLVPKIYKSERVLHRIVLLVSTGFKKLLKPPNILLMSPKASNEELLEYVTEIVEKKQMAHPSNNKETTIGHLSRSCSSRVMVGGFSDNNKKVDLKKMKQHWTSKLSARKDSDQSLMLVLYELFSETDQSLKIKS